MSSIMDTVQKLDDDLKVGGPEEQALRWGGRAGLDSLTTQHRVCPQLKVAATPVRQWPPAALERCVAMPHLVTPG